MRVINLSNVKGEEIEQTAKGINSAQQFMQIQFYLSIPRAGVMQ